MALRAPRALAPLERWHLQEELAHDLGMDVDLVDLWQASTVLRWQVVRTGRLLVMVEANERDWFEMLALSAYARLQEERKFILQDIVERGSVHG